MKLGLPDFTIAKLYPCYAFELPPSALPVNAAQPRDVPDPAADRDDLNVGDLSIISKSIAVLRACSC
jgi:hypothetical protein